MICVLMISVTGSNILPAFYLICAAALGLVTASLVRETAFGDLEA